MKLCRAATLRLLLAAVMMVAGMEFAAAAPGRYYTLRAGESLTQVAGRNGITVDQLARANGVNRNARLSAGTRLWIPATARHPAAAAPRPATTAKPVSSKPAASTAGRPVVKPSNSAKPAASAPRPAPPEVESAPPPPAPVADEPGIHVVGRGDTLWGIANKYGLTVSDVARMNGIKSTTPLEVGQRLKVSGEALDEVPGGGLDKPGTASSSASSAPPPPVAPSDSPRPSAKGYIWPAEGRILHRFKDSAEEKFPGIDISVPSGTEIRAANRGKVVYTGSGIPGYGNLVIVEHAGDVATVYAQLGRVLVREGQELKRGQVLGRSGTSSRGEEILRFEIRRDGDAVNPTAYLP